MRIVGGSLRARQIATPSGRSTRPTSDRLRETAFDILAHRFGQPAEGARVLDLFAGSGALGLEAVSRGAGYALFVENDAAARAAIRRNIDDLGLAGVTRIFRRDATRLGPAGNTPPFDLVFADPPYGFGHGEQALAAALEGGWISPDALIVLEESSRSEHPGIAGLEQRHERKVGDTVLRFFNLATTGQDAPAATL